MASKEEEDKEVGLSLGLVSLVEGTGSVYTLFVYWIKSKVAETRKTDFVFPSSKGIIWQGGYVLVFATLDLIQ